MEGGVLVNSYYRPAAYLPSAVSCCGVATVQPRHLPPSMPDISFEPVGGLIWDMGSNAGRAHCRVFGPIMTSTQPFETH